MAFRTQIPDALRRPEPRHERILARTFRECRRRRPLDLTAVLPSVDNDSRRPVAPVPREDDEILTGEEIGARGRLHLGQ